MVSSILHNNVVLLSPKDLSAQRSKLALAASAFHGVPSENVIPSLSLMVNSVALSLAVYSVASMGMIFISSSNPNNPSMIRR